jgi:hypothetical protein
MNARYWPCLGVKTGRESLAARFIVALDSGGSAMNIRYRVELSEAERAQLTALLSGGKHAARKLKRAQILLAADAGLATKRSPPASRLAGPRFTEPNDASWKAIWSWR